MGDWEPVGSTGVWTGGGGWGVLKLVFYCNGRDNTEIWVSGNRECGESIESTYFKSVKTCSILGIPQGLCCSWQ